MSLPKKLRNPYIYELFKNGENLAQIGREFDLSRERIRKICDKEKAKEGERIRKQIRKKNEKF